LTRFTINRSKTGGDGNQGNLGGTLPLKKEETMVTVRVFVDHSIVEAFAQGGRSAITARIYTDPSDNGIALMNQGSAPTTVSVNVWEMDACWV
jgi:beta-fructofuranosidase